MIEPVVTYLERGDNEAQTASLGKLQHLQPRLWAREYPAQGESRGALAVMHDHGEHGGRYAKLAVRLAEDGWNVSVFDFRSHGDSDGDRSGSFRGADDPLQDLDLALTHLTIFIPESARVAVGTGLGGLVAMAYALRHPESLAGFVAFNPDLRPGPAYRKPGGMLSSLFGGGVLGIDPKDRFRSPQRAAEFAADKKLTTKRDGKTEAAIEELRKLVSAGGSSLRAEGLVVASRGDRVADPAAARELCAKSGGRVSLLETDLGHAAVHDDDAESAVKGALEFLAARFPRGANKVPRL